MKIGIITLWNSYCNYGEQLQNFALQEYLRRLGHEPFLIRYDYGSDTLYGRNPVYKRLVRALNPRILSRYIHNAQVKRRSLDEQRHHPRHFEEFRDAHLKMTRIYSSIDDLRNNPPEADMYITGSDQVWNTFQGAIPVMKNRLSAFYLDFGSENVLRASYAASFGRTELSDEETSYIKPLLARFDAVSVREKSGLELCSGIGRGDAALSPDPTMLLDAGVYRDLSEGEGVNRRDGKYLFFYYLGTDRKFDKKAVFDWAEAKGLEVVYVTDSTDARYEKSYPTIPEWLNLIDKADCVLTNSFHCGIFSVLFGKKFGIIKRSGEYKAMNTRMDSLFEYFGMEPRYVADGSFDDAYKPYEISSDVTNASLSSPEEIISKATEIRAVQSNTDKNY